MPRDAKHRAGGEHRGNGRGDDPGGATRVDGEEDSHPCGEGGNGEADIERLVSPASVMTTVCRSLEQLFPRATLIPADG